ncbi:sensor histidine kinase [Ruminiclostridium cellobioparum]|uniref:sensor histidine kinase n=1 Tax=Ruminiclostridium cellobioparum TaxID=29355 RepID=UPI00048925F7|nr:histidine kinase [Ruminiclostridium cellobioparum]
MSKMKQGFFSKSISYKIIAPLCLLVLVIQVFNSFIFSSRIAKRYEIELSEANLETTNQISNNIHLALKNIVNEMIPVKNQMISFEMQHDMEKKKTGYTEVNVIYQGMFSKLLSSGDNFLFISSMLVLDKRNKIYYLSQNQSVQLRNDNLFEKVKKDYHLKEYCQWSGVISESYYFNNKKEDIVSIFMPYVEYGEVKTIFVVNLSIKHIQQYIDRLSNEQGNILLQIGGDYLYSDNLNKMQLEEDLSLKSILQSEKRDQQALSDSFFVGTKSLDINSWKVYSLLPKSNIKEASSVMGQFFTFIIITTSLVMILGVFITVYFVTKPIKKMRKIIEANRITKERSHRFHSKYKDEVGVLADSYDHMMDEINQYTADLKKEQAERRIADFKMLQLQIKPHFLYNTLEAAKFLVQMNDPNGVDMLTAIGKFYKLSLSGVIDKIEIRDEIEHLSYYLKILKMRYSSIYDYNIEIDEEVKSFEIIKFSMQPIIENAVYHGIKKQRKKGAIIVRGYIEDNSITLSVWDNGVGISEEKLEEIRYQLKHSKQLRVVDHIGIINVHQRINMEYGDPYGVNIESIQDKYTRVSLRLPLKKYTEEKNE